MKTDAATAGNDSQHPAGSNTQQLTAGTAGHKLSPPTPFADSNCCFSNKSSSSGANVSNGPGLPSQRNG